jgi:hypothetical protein
VAQNDPNDEQYIFKSGSALDWQIASKLLKQEFQVNRVWKYVEAPAGMGVDPNIPWEEITTFNIPRPVLEDYIDSRVQPLIEGNDAALETQIEEALVMYPLGNNPGPGGGATAAERTRLRLAEESRARVEREKARTREIAEQVKATADFEQVMINWEKKREKHEEDVAKCQKIFLRIAPSAAHDVTNLLENFQYRRAWFELNAHYGIGIGGAINAQSLHELLNTLVLKDHNLNELLEEIRHIVEQLNSIGDVVSENAQMVHIVGAIQRSSYGRYYRDVLSFHENSRSPLPVLISALQAEASKWKIGKLVRKRRSESSSAAIEPEEFANIVQPAPWNQPKKKKGNSGAKKVQANAALIDIPTCTLCHKQGHTAASCWTTKICDCCGVKGHIAKVCPQRQRANAVTNEEEKNRKVSVEKHFKNKHPKP